MDFRSFTLFSSLKVHTPYTSDEGMSCHSTRIELFYFDDNSRRIAQWACAKVCYVTIVGGVG